MFENLMLNCNYFLVKVNNFSTKKNKILLINTNKRLLVGQVVSQFEFVKRNYPVLSCGNFQLINLNELFYFFIHLSIIFVGYSFLHSLIYAILSWIESSIYAVDIQKTI